MNRLRLVLLLLVLGATLLFAYGMVGPMTQRAPQKWPPHLSSETKVRQLFGARVRRMLAARQYEQLEYLADSLLRTGETFPNGIPRSASFFSRGFAEVDDDNSADQRSDQLQNLRDWCDARPLSGVARIALAQGLIGHALSARGSALAAAVPQTRAMQYLRDNDEAVRLLEQAPDNPTLHGAWFTAELEALNGLGPGADSLYREVARVALSQYPTDFGLYLMIAQHLMPRWYGHAGEWETFADTCASGLPDSTRDEIYARILERQSHYSINLFAANQKLAWVRARRGLELWARHCPDSYQPQSALAYLACQSGDRPTALQAFERLGDRVEMDVWDEWSVYWLAREWAYSTDTKPFSFVPL
jgi:hypothetical protein